MFGTPNPFLPLGGANVYPGPTFGGIKTPVGFDYDWDTYFKWQMWLDRLGHVRTDFSPDHILRVLPEFNGETYYLDAAGNDANSGLTQALPKKSFKQASGLIPVANAAGAPIIVFIKGGFYDIDNGWNGGTRFSVPVILIGYGGRPVSSVSQTAVFTSDGNSYSTTTFTTCGRVADTLNRGVYRDYTEMVELTTEAEVKAHVFTSSVGGVWNQDGSKITVRRADGLAPNTATNTRMFRHSIEGVRCATAGDTLIYNLEVEGGNNGAVVFDANASANCWAVGVNAKWAGRPSSPVDQFKIRDVAFGGFYGCVTAKSMKDGFNFSEGAGTKPIGLTIACSGYDIGSEFSTSCNALTYHDGLKGLDINGTYFNCGGGGVALVNPETQLWCVGTASRDNYGDEAAGGNTPPCNFQGSAEGQVFMSYTISSMNIPGDKDKFDIYQSGGGEVYYEHHTNLTGTPNRGNQIYEIER